MIQIQLSLFEKYDDNRKASHPETVRRTIEAKAEMVKRCRDRPFGPEHEVSNNVQMKEGPPREHETAT